MTATIKLSNVTKTLGGRAVLRDVSLVVNSGDVAGVVGPNGSGKATLLRIAARTLAPDAGSIDATPGLRIGVLPQGFEVAQETTVADLFPLLAPLVAVEERVAVVAGHLASEDDEAAAARLADEYDALLARIAAPASDLEGVRAELGLREVAPATRVASLSGGELRKLALLHLVASEPDALLLDEPTNHLDSRGIQSGRGVHRGVRGAGPRRLARPHSPRCLRWRNHRDGSRDTGRRGVSRELLGLCRRASASRGRAVGALRTATARGAAAQARNLAIESRSRNIEQRTINFHYRKRAKKVARRAVTLKARMQREAASAEHLDRPTKPSGGFRGKFETPDAGRASRLVSAIDVALEVGGRRLVEGATFDLKRGERVVLMGANGSGKTTLLRAILGEHPIVEGELSVHPAAQPGYLPQEEAGGASRGDSHATAIDLVRRSAAESRRPRRTTSSTASCSGTIRSGRLSSPQLRRAAATRLGAARARWLEPAAPRRADEPPRHPVARGVRGSPRLVRGRRAHASRTTATSSSSSRNIVLELSDGRLRRIA